MRRWFVPLLLVVLSFGCGSEGAESTVSVAPPEPSGQVDAASAEGNVLEGRPAGGTAVGQQPVLEGWATQPPSTSFDVVSRGTLVELDVAGCYGLKLEGRGTVAIVFPSGTIAQDDRVILPSGMEVSVGAVVDAILVSASDPPAQWIDDRFDSDLAALCADDGEIFGIQAIFG